MRSSEEARLVWGSQGRGRRGYPVWWEVEPTVFPAGLELGRDRDRDGSQGRLRAFGLSPWKDGTATS